MTASLGLGLAALGRPGYINLGHAEDLGHRCEPEAMRAHAFAMLDAAFALGMRWIDAARSYGKAEEFLAAWLQARSIAPGTLTVSSKWGYTYVADWRVAAPRHEVKDHSLAALRRQWPESRALLGAHLTIYQIHSATLESGVLEDAAVLAELARIKGCGVRLGLSLSGPRQADALRLALTHSVDGVQLFDACQATWNPLEPSCAPALAEAKAAGWTVLVKEALANGRLTERGVLPAALRHHATRLLTTADALALAAALAQPWADVVFSGAATVAHLRSNAVGRALRLDAEARAALGELAEPPEEYWRARGRLSWN